MNCLNIQRRIREADLHHLDADLQKHLARCPECKKEYDSILALNRLIGLKKYEQPAPGFEKRNIDTVLMRLQNLENDPAALGNEALPPRPAGIMDFLFHPQPAVQLAWAAGLLLLIGLSAALFMRGQNEEQIAQPLPLPAATELATSSTNIEPANIQFGPQPSKAADFKY